MARNELRELAEQLIFGVGQKLPAVKKALQALCDRLRSTLALVDRTLATQAKA